MTAGKMSSWAKSRRRFRTNTGNLDERFSRVRRSNESVSREIIERYWVLSQEDIFIFGRKAELKCVGVGKSNVGIFQHSPCFRALSPEILFKHGRELGCLRMKKRAKSSRSHHWLVLIRPLAFNSQ